MEAEVENLPENTRITGTVIINLALPFAILGLYILLLYIALPESLFIYLITLMFLYFIPPAGKESVIPLGVAIGIPWWTVGISIAMMDILSTLFMVLNFELALKIPVLGTKWMRMFMEHGEAFFRSHRWLEQLSTLGLAIFVMIPMQGTGGIATPIVGRMIGLPPAKVLIAVITGAMTGCMLIALGSEYLKNLLTFDFRLGIAAIMIIVVLIVSGWLLWRRRERRLREKKPAHKI